MKTEVLIPQEILERPDVPIHVKLVYGRVAILLGKRGSAVLTTDELARQCGITRRQAAKSLSYLVTLGLVHPHESLSGRGLLRVFRKAASAETEDSK